MKKTLFIVFLFLSFGLWKGANAQTEKKNQVWDGSQTVPVHLIPLKDEFNQPIIPSESYPLPFSSRYTCAPCHDYGAIKKGLHFNTFEGDQSGRAGEPFFWVENKSGTVLPISCQGWKGTWHPRELGLSAWDFTLLFGRHMTGGGVLEPEEGQMSPHSRWNVSGKVEINCMGCHSSSRLQSHSEWAKQILRENFRWAATAASGLGEVGGMASRLPGTWDLYDGPNPDDTEWAVAPSVRYNPSLFDSKFRVFFGIAEKPDDSRCLVCHSVTPVQIEKMDLDSDVHSDAGLQCVDCHRNGIDHDMIRGYEGEFSCSGCHLGKNKKKSGRKPSGRMGAPFPRHRGLPPVHLERLACTACHSGPWIGRDLTRVRTSRANRLGIYGIAQWMTEIPQIVEPVLVRSEEGKITPHRLVWPAFWAKLVEGEVSPLKPEDVLAVAGEVFSSEERVARVLLALFRYPEIGGVPVLLSGGKRYVLNADGGLDVQDYRQEQVAQDQIALDVFWAVETEKEIVPLIPEFDPETEKMDLDVETHILSVFDALATYEYAPGKPALAFGDTIYHSVEGYLEKTENPGQYSPEPRLCWLVGDKLEPLIDDFDLRTVLATSGLEQTLTEEQVERALEALNRPTEAGESETNTQHGYVSGGKMFVLDEDGYLSASDHVSAGPVTWPLGHRVRPAQQSLGSNGCRDCHRAGSPLFFSRVKGFGPLLTQRVRERSQSFFMGLTQPYQRVFGLTFSVRPLFKAVLFASAIILGALLLIVFLLVLGRASGLVNKKR